MSLLLISSFLFFAVIMRICIQRFHTGDFGVRIASPKAPLIEILPGTVFVFSFTFALLIIVLNRVEVLSSVHKLSNIIRWGGFMIGAIGILFTVVSQHQMGDSWRIGVDSDETTMLKTGGLYARSRNPIYFGILLFWIGLSITFVHPLLWLCAMVCWICIEIIVRKIEEPYLEKVHDKLFLDYVERTNRYLPI